MNSVVQGICALHMFTCLPRLLSGGAVALNSCPGWKAAAHMVLGARESASWLICRLPRINVAA